MISSDMSIRRCLPLERHFFVLMLILGVCLLLIASTLIQTSHYDIFRQYVIAKNAVIGRNLAPVSGDTIDHITKLFNKASVFPVTDPPWMTKDIKPTLQFMPMESHPFLGENVIENPDVCGNASVDLLIVIHSAANNFQKRRILRETWAATGTFHGVSVRRVFALGRDKSGVKSQVFINTEQANFGDIVQGNFTDTFPNLTRKAVTMLRWINDHCLQARFLLKTDDDVFINVFSLVERYLQRLEGKEHAVLCRVKPENISVIVRDPKSKWYVPKSLLAGRTHWPRFCCGFVVALTTHMVPELYMASFKAPYVPVDDSYVFGILPLMSTHSALMYVDISSDLVVDDGKLLAHYKQSPHSYVGGTAQNEADVVKLWQTTVANLSPWSRLRAHLVKLQVNVSATVL